MATLAWSEKDKYWVLFDKDDSEWWLSKVLADLDGDASTHTEAYLNRILTRMEWTVGQRLILGMTLAEAHPWEKAWRVRLDPAKIYDAVTHAELGDATFEQATKVRMGDRFDMEINGSKIQVYVL